MPSPLRRIYTSKVLSAKQPSPAQPSASQPARRWRTCGPRWRPDLLDTGDLAIPEPVVILESSSLLGDGNALLLDQAPVPRLLFMTAPAPSALRASAVPP